MAEKKFPDLFAFDLDGTLVHRNLKTGDRDIPDPLLEQVHRISEKAHIVIATGRRYRAIQDDLKKLPEVRFAIVHNGLSIRDSKKAVVERAAVSIEEIEELARAVDPHIKDYFFVCDGFDHQYDYLYFRSKLLESENLKKVDKRLGANGKVLESWQDLRSLQLPLLEVAALGDYVSLMRIKKDLEHKLPHNFRSVVVKNIGYEDLSVIEIFKKSYSKWSGVEWVKKKLGAERVIAVGDDQNDLEMIQFADMGVAMKHAESEIRKVSKAEVDGAEGLTKFLKEFY